MTIRHISIIMAMMDEAKPVIDGFSLKKKEGVFPDRVPMALFSGETADGKISLVWNGRDAKTGADNVATQPATLAAYLAVTLLRPDIVISAGTAGGFAANGSEIGDVYASCGVFRFHDRRIPFGNFAEYGVGAYSSADVSAVARDLGLKQGEVSTGDSLESIERDLDIIRSSGAAAKEMEAAAIAWICRMLNVPMFAVKSIVDLLDVEEPTNEQFNRNLEMGSINLQKSLLEVIPYCFGRKMEDLAE